MHGIYGFVVGPLAWIASAIFVLGVIYRFISMFILTKKKDPLVFEYMDLKYSLRSIIHWAVPFAALNWRKHPALTVVTFVFHFCLLAVPVFLLAHIVLWDNFHGISYWSLPDHIADIMAVLVMAGCVFFAVRRLVRPEVRYVTSAMDWVVLILVALPFVTGFLAYHQIGNYKFMIIFHILSGEVMLAAIPFTRLSHMLFAPFTRAYIGSEFGAVRHVKDW